MAELNPNTISIFKNEEKKSEKSPDYSGNIELNGTKYRVALWLKQAKSGKAFLGGAITEHTEYNQAAKPVVNNVTADLPF
jgi:hypothetical protein